MKIIQQGDERMCPMNAVNRIAIVSLSSGILGESFVRFEVEIGLASLNMRMRAIARIIAPYHSACVHHRAAAGGRHGCGGQDADADRR